MLEELTITLDRLGEKPAAVGMLDALAKHSREFSQFDEVAKCYFKIKEYQKAFDYSEKALALVHNNPQQEYASKYNVINTANHANYPERAMVLIKQLERINPNDIDVRLEKAFGHFLLNQKNEAEKILRAELENPLNDEVVKNKIRFNLGTYELLRDEFQSGLQKFLFEGRKMDLWKKPQLPFTFWDGTMHREKTLFVRAEAGIGDEFINVRFMNTIKERGMKPIWVSDRQEIVDLFNRNGYDSITTEKAFRTRSNEEMYWTHSMDLPVYLNLQYEDLWKGPYLRADDKLVDYVKPMFNQKRLKIGFRWQGNPGYDQDLHRSIPLAEMYNAVKHLDADFYSIQRDDGLEELEGLPITDLSSRLMRFENTLAIIQNLDLVITSCTSVAHAAAAMGKETIVITPISAYYVWCHTMEQSPWYGNHVKLLRQEKPRSWKEPLNKLTEYVNGRFDL
jgi:hypothetical protein